MKGVAPFPRLGALNDVTPWYEGSAEFASTVGLLLLPTGSSTLTISFEFTPDDGTTTFAIEGEKVTDRSYATSDAWAAASTAIFRRFNATGGKVRAKVTAYTSGSVDVKPVGVVG